MNVVLLANGFYAIELRPGSSIFWSDTPVKAWRPTGQGKNTAVENKLKRRWKRSNNSTHTVISELNSHQVDPEPLSHKGFSHYDPYPHKDVVSNA